jgi:hypothetical protein
MAIGPEIYQQHLQLIDADKELVEVRNIPHHFAPHPHHNVATPQRVSNYMFHVNRCRRSS